MRILFFGLGSIGRRHARILKKRGSCELYAYRTGESRGNDLGIKEFYDLKEALNTKPDIAFITNPTSLHVKTARMCADKGISLFIEKPLSCDMKGVKTLKAKIDEKGIYAYAAMCMRFHPVLEEIKKTVSREEVIYSKTTATSYLPNWRPNARYELSYSAHSRQGGGILLDLIHELDYNYWLFGDVKNIAGRYGKISALEGDAEDYADMLIEYKNGINGSIHLNWFSMLNERNITVYCKGRTLKGDLVNNTLTISNMDGTVKEKKFDIGADTIYEKQVDYFLDAYKNRKEPMNKLDDAIKVLGYTLKFKSGNTAAGKTR